MHCTVTDFILSVLRVKVEEKNSYVVLKNSVRVSFITKMFLYKSFKTHTSASAYGIYNYNLVLKIQKHVHETEKNQ